MNYPGVGGVVHMVALPAWLYAVVPELIYYPALIWLAHFCKIRFEEDFSKLTLTSNIVLEHGKLLVVPKPISFFYAYW